MSNTPVSTDSKKRLPVIAWLLSPLWFPILGLFFVLRFLHRRGCLSWVILLAVDSAMSIYVYEIFRGKIMLKDTAVQSIPNWIWLLIGGLLIVILVISITLGAIRRKDIYRGKM